MDITQQTQSKLIVARTAIESLKKTADGSASGGGLSPEIAVLERDVIGASSKFLFATKKEKLTSQVAQKKINRSKDPKIEDGWVTLRFRITPDQRHIIMAAMERAREMSNLGGAKQWKGISLEYVAADFLASHGPPVNVPDPQNPRGP